MANAEKGLSAQIASLLGLALMTGASFYCWSFLDSDLPTGNEVKEAFDAQNPAYEALEVFLEEQDGPAFTCKIVYRRRSDDRAGTVYWRYEKDANREWQPVDQPTPKPPLERGDPGW